MMKIKAESYGTLVWQDLYKDRYLCQLRNSDENEQWLLVDVIGDGPRLITLCTNDWLPGTYKSELRRIFDIRQLIRNLLRDQGDWREAEIDA